MARQSGNSHACSIYTKSRCADFHALVSAASAVAALPQTSQWRVACEASCCPINQITLKDGSGLRRVGVYNWNEETRALEEPIGGFSDLPDPIQNLLKLTNEAEESGLPEINSDPALVRETRDVLESAM